MVNQARISRKKITQAWMLAAADLGIVVVAPWVITWGDLDYQFIGLIKKFGSRKGTLLCSPGDFYYRDYGGLAELNGYYCSGLYKSYETYERAHFIATLDDWGWAGRKGEEPDWYSGKRWGS